MDGYNRNNQDGKMSLEEVLKLYNGQEGEGRTKDNGSYKDLSPDNNIIIPEGDARHKTPVKQFSVEAPGKRKHAPSRRKGASFAEASSWFQTICWLNIPVFGFFYMFALLIRKRTPRHKKNFIIGYIMYKALVWLLAIVLVYCLYKAGLDFIDGILRYVT